MPTTAIDGTLRQQFLAYEERVSAFQLSESHTEAIRAVSFNANGTLLATGGDDNAIRIWSCLDGTLKFFIEGHTPVLCLRWTADPFVLIAGFEDNLLATVVVSFQRVRFQ